MHEYSVLGTALGQVDDLPYPHVYMRKALPDEVYLRLVKSRPDIETILAGREVLDNHRYDLSAVDLLEIDLSTGWRKFVGYHTSDRLWFDVCKIFGAHIRIMYPSLEETLGCPLEQAGCGIRGMTDAPIRIDCQIGINTPRTAGKARVRGPHIDNAKELFACMFYMKDPDDDQPGGDLVVYEPKEWPLVFHGKAELRDKEVKAIKTIKYSANRAFAWINAPHAIHGVTERPIGAPPRLLVNIIVELESRLFRTQRDHK